MGVALTPEQIAEIMAPKSKAKEKPQTRRFPAPPQHGPLRYYETSDLCVVAGYWSYPENNEEKVWVKTKSGCRTQTHYRLQGIPMCATHALRAMNDLLIDANIEWKDFIVDDAAQMEIDALKEMQSRLIRVNDELVRKVEP